MKSIRRILTLAFLLAVCLATWVSAEENAKLLLDSGHNAAIEFKKTDASKGLDGTFDIGGDFAKGLSTMKADFKFGPEIQKEFGDASGGFYANVGQNVEAVGNLDVTLPDDAKKNAPKKAEGQLESVFGDAKSYAKGTLSIVTPVPNAVPKINVDGKLDGTSKTFNGKTNFGFDLGAERAKNVPFKSFGINISDKASDKETLTTLKISVALDAKSPYANSFKEVGKAPDKIQGPIKGGLAAYNFQVEKVELLEFKDSPDVSGTLVITFKDLRKSITGLIDPQVASMAQMQKFDAEKIKADVAKIMEVKVNNFDVKIALDGTAVKGSIEGALENTNAFLVGYYDMVGEIVEAQLKSKGEEADFGSKMGLAYQAVAMEDAKKIITVFAESDIKFNGDFKLALETGGAPAGTATPAATPAAGQSNDLKIDGDFNLNFDNVKSYIDKAVAAGLPFGKSSAAKLQFKLSDGGHINGTLYAFNDAKVLDYYKSLLVKTLRKAGAPEDQVKLVDGITINGGQMAFNASKAGVTGSGFAETSSLVPVVKAIVATADKNFSGDPSGFTISGKTDKDKINIDGKIFISKLMEGKSAADIKAASGLDVKEGAKPEEVKLVAIEKPEVKIPASLVAVQDDGKKLLSTSVVAAIPGMNSLNQKTGGNGMFILGGLIAAIVVGAGMAAGRKKS